MKPTDQYFKAGDKVMRVGGNQQPIGSEYYPNDGKVIPQYGKTYCVEDFWEGPVCNVVVFVGGGGWARNPHNGDPIGWPASAFRKVEEIKLCVAALLRVQVDAPMNPSEPLNLP